MGPAIGLANPCVYVSGAKMGLEVLSPICCRSHSLSLVSATQVGGGYCMGSLYLWFFRITR